MGKQYLRIFGNNFERVTDWNNTLFGICRNYSLFYIRFKENQQQYQTIAIRYLLSPIVVLLLAIVYIIEKDNKSHSNLQSVAIFFC